MSFLVGFERETNIQLPSYTPSPPPPTYTANATEGEQSITRSNRLHPNYHTPTGTFTRTRGNITVVLNEQDDDAEIPSYGRHALISGTINLDHTESVSKVTLQIEGRLKLSISGSNAVSKTVKTVDECYEIWSEHARVNKSKSLCPHSIPFSSVLPSTFRDGERELPLPPSYEVTFLGVPSLFARCMYTLKVTVHTHGALLGRSKTLNIPVNYRPRKRPPQPILPDPSFLSTVKTSPEEWYQSTSELKARPSTNLGPIHAHLFVPAVRTFGLSDSIPIHIQFTGSISSLQEFYSHVRLGGGESDDSSSSSTSSSSFSSPSPLDPSSSHPLSSIPIPPSIFSQSYHSYVPYLSAPIIRPTSSSPCPASSPASPTPPSTSCTPRTYSRKNNNLSLTLSFSLNRQVSVEIKGQTVWKNATIGLGQLRALPPSFWSRGLDEANSESVETMSSLDWEGEVRCRADVKVGHFDAGKIAVKDFLLLTVDTKPNQSAFFPLRMAVPIALVTDTWTER